mgnify:CR=1 FL=1|tara:strand:+ start:1066 stop:1773 length:708 start_codon:yes stop_codon:yes gene_type:complete
MIKSLIIARFNEDLNWLQNHKEFKITIYNKGNPIKDKSLGKIINLDNVGRESHTWLTHITNNYEQLDDVNIFLQGRIDDLNCMAFKDPNSYLKNIEKFGFVASRLGLLTPFHWKYHIGIEKNKKYKCAWDNYEISRSNIGFRKFAKNYFPEIPLFVNTSYGGCFAVKKDLIKKYDLKFYEELLEVLSKHKNPIEGHFMERLWCYMFIKNKQLRRSIMDVIQTKVERLKLNLTTMD